MFKAFHLTNYILFSLLRQVALIGVKKFLVTATLYVIEICKPLTNDKMILLEKSYLFKMMLITWVTESNSYRFGKLCSEGLRANIKILEITFR